MTRKSHRWYYLLELSGLLSEGKAVLEELVGDEIESPNFHEALGRGFLKKRKRSPRNPNNLLAEPKKPIGDEEQTPETSSGGECEQSPKSTLCKNPNFKFIFKRPIGDDQIPPETTRGGVECDQSPNFKKRAFHAHPPDSNKKMKKSRFELGESSSSTPPLKNTTRQRFFMDRHIINNNIQGLLQPPLPEGIGRRIIETGGCLESAVCVIEKALYPTDVDSGKCRLSAPLRQVRGRFLLPGEVEMLLAQGGIRTTLIQPSLVECEITFGLWGSNTMYVLKNGWNNVYINNKLTHGMKIRLWAFRRNLVLCFALETM